MVERPAFGAVVIQEQAVPGAVPGKLGVRLGVGRVGQVFPGLLQGFLVLLQPVLSAFGGVCRGRGAERVAGGVAHRASPPGYR